MFSSIISSAAISSASSFTSATIVANMAAGNFVTTTDSILSLNMKIAYILLFVLICVAFCVTFYITYKTFKNN